MGPNSCFILIIFLIEKEGHEGLIEIHCNQDWEAKFVSTLKCFPNKLKDRIKLRS